MNKYLIMAATALSFAACSSDDTEVATSGEDVAPDFSAVITRAVDDTWDAGDQIGISGESGGVTYTNVAYTTGNGDGTFTVNDESTKIYYKDDKEATFKAYYPWNAGDMTADTREQSKQKTFDYLFAIGTGSRTTNKDVAFNFFHKMSKIVINVKSGDDEVTLDDVQKSKFTVYGLLTSGSFDKTTGTATASGNETTTFCFANNTENAIYNATKADYKDKDGNVIGVSYTLILFPQELKNTVIPLTATLPSDDSLDGKINVLTANKSKDGDNAKNELKAGRQYNVTVSMNKSALVVAGCSITNWETVNVEGEVPLF